jgi:hypothetical protein
MSSSQVCCSIGATAWAVVSDIHPHSSAKNCGIVGIKMSDVISDETNQVFCLL